MFKLIYTRQKRQMKIILCLHCKLYDVNSSAVIFWHFSVLFKHRKLRINLNTSSLLVSWIETLY